LKFIVLKDSENLISGIANAMAELSAWQPEIAIELIAFLETDNDEKIKGIMPAIILGLTTSKGTFFTLPILLSKLQSIHEYDVKNGLFILSRINLDENDWENFGDQIIKQLTLFENGANEIYRALLPEVYVLHLRFIPSAEEFLISYSKSDNPQYQLAMSHIVWLRDEKFDNELLYETIVVNSASWDYSKPGIAHNMKLCALHLVNKNPLLAIKYWNAWIGNGRNQLEQLSIFKHDITTLYSQNKKLSEDWITLSFRSENESFHRAMQIIISNLWVDGFKHLSLSKKLLNTFLFFEIKYILFKILAFVHSKEPLESLVFSILEKEPFDSHSARLAANAFIQYICYNYGGTYNYLKKRGETASEEQREVIKSITESLDEYHKHLKNIPRINELKWQNKQGVSFVQVKMHKMSKEFKEGMEKNKEDFLRSSFTKINLKGGKKFFRKYEGNYTKPAPMQNVGTSFELPVGEFIDPIKEVINRIEWRKYKMEV
jgi:hypothetical protein